MSAHTFKSPPTIAVPSRNTFYTSCICWSAMLCAAGIAAWPALSSRGLSSEETNIRIGTSRCGRSDRGSSCAIPSTSSMRHGAGASWLVNTHRSRKDGGRSPESEPGHLTDLSSGSGAITPQSSSRTSKISRYSARVAPPRSPDLNLRLAATSRRVGGSLLFLALTSHIRAIDARIVFTAASTPCSFASSTASAALDARIPSSDSRRMSVEASQSTEILR